MINISEVDMSVDNVVPKLRDDVMGVHDVTENVSNDGVCVCDTVAGVRRGDTSV